MIGNTEKFKVFIILNLFLLDLFVLQNIFASQQKQDTLVEPVLKEQSFDTSFDTSLCPNSCLTEIKNATASLGLSQITPTKAQEKTPTSQQTLLREYFVPFGSGSSNATEWTDVPGLQAYLDINEYGSIKKVVFEVSLHTPTGNQFANARLYNKTDNYVIWLSDVSIEGGEPKLLTSAPLTLSSGNKLYQVQMKTQLGSKTNLSQARLRITAY